MSENMALLDCPVSRGREGTIIIVGEQHNTKIMAKWHGPTDDHAVIESTHGDSVFRKTITSAMIFAPMSCTAINRSHLRPYSLFITNFSPLIITLLKLSNTILPTDDLLFHL